MQLQDPQKYVVRLDQFILLVSLFCYIVYEETIAVGQEK